VSTATDNPRVIVALDFSDAAAAEHLVDRLDPTLCRIKVGKELFTRAGPALVSRLVSRGFKVFLDLKFHDIPNTVARACAAAANLGVWMLNVHALGGRKMMEAAREALADRAEARPLLIAVTILTSLGEEDIREVGLQGMPGDNVVRLAGLAKTAGLDGVVCSPLETTSLRQNLGTDFLLVTPGVRPAGAARGDQRRVLTPAEAIERGADYLVIGRPVTQAPDPLEALRQINADLAHLTG
jgi:orotidine-5'-phosphate decarboxylase